MQTGTSVILSVIFLRKWRNLRQFEQLSTSEFWQFLQLFLQRLRTWAFLRQYNLGTIHNIQDLLTFINMRCCVYFAVCQFASEDKLAIGCLAHQGAIFLKLSQEGIEMERELFMGSCFTILKS